ncbi:MAG: hypothetical protein HY515_02740 [Candidatus Aenigmarchaeota archaeon]|nr:hypothetical protein [Candidatus Aenigmarchaeota archaeon]
MTTATAIPIDQEIQVPRDTYPLKYSSRLVRTINHLPQGYATAEQGKADFYDALKVAAVMTMDAQTKGEISVSQLLTPSDSNEAHHIYVQKSGGAKKLRDVEALRDYFANNDESWYAWEETLTGLRFRESDLRRPMPYNVGDKITAERIETEIPLDILMQIADPKFARDNFRDIIGIINKVDGTVDVPYARGHVIREMRSGIFTEVGPTTEHGESYALHGWLPENLYVPKDPISGHYDLAVGRGSAWRHGDGCLGVGALCGRSGAASSDGFRPVVRGSVQGRKIDVVSAGADIEQIRREIEGNVRAEVASDMASLRAILEKYRV